MKGSLRALLQHFPPDLVHESHQPVKAYQHVYRDAVNACYIVCTSLLLACTQLKGICACSSQTMLMTDEAVDLYNIQLAWSTYLTWAAQSFLRYNTFVPFFIMWRSNLRRCASSVGRCSQPALLLSSMEEYLSARYHSEVAGLHRRFQRCKVGWSLAEGPGDIGSDQLPR